MFVTPTDVKSWRPSQLSTVVEAFQGVRDDLDDQLSNLADAARSALDDWTGVGADSAYNRAMSEKGVGEELSERMGDLITELRDGSQALGSVRDNAVSKINAAQLDQFEVTEQWDVVDVFVGPLTPEQKAARLELERGHREDLSEARRQTLEEDARVSNAIDGAIDELVAAGDDAEEGRFYEPPNPDSLTGQELSALFKDPRFLEWVAEHRDEAKEFLDPLFDHGRISEDDIKNFYGPFLDNYWAYEALEQAGIDPDSWDPAKGTGPNAENIEAVYNYYGQLFLNNPDFQWAGMANMIGPSFAGGFHDLKMLRDWVKTQPSLNSFDLWRTHRMRTSRGTKRGSYPCKRRSSSTKLDSMRLFYTVALLRLTDLNGRK